jgi:hypothetical protein
MVHTIVTILQSRKMGIRRASVTYSVLYGQKSMEPEFKLGFVWFFPPMAYYFSSELYTDKQSRVLEVWGRLSGSGQSN